MSTIKDEITAQDEHGIPTMITDDDAVLALYQRIASSNNGHPASSYSPARPWQIIPSPSLLKQLMSGSGGPMYLLGTLIPREAVALWVGESSAGKTYLMHALGYALSTGTEFLGMTPPRPLKVLHVDFESNGAITRGLLRAFGTNARWHFAKVTGTRNLLRMLKEVAHQYDVIIVDSIMVASPVNDENSNSEANRQIVPFTRIAQKSKAAILLLHNAGEGNPKEKFKSRGATARVDRPDMVVNLDDLGGAKRRLKVVKSRFPNLGQTLEYEIVSTPEIPVGYRLIKDLEKPVTKQEMLERRVTAACRKYFRKYPDRSLSRKQIAKGLRVKKSQVKLFNRTLKTLTEREILLQPQRGQYQYATAQSA